MFAGRNLIAAVALLLGAITTNASAAETSTVRRLTLADVMALAREQNPDVVSAREKTREAAAQTMISRSRMLPNVSGLLSESKQRLSTAGLALPEQTVMQLPARIPFDVRVKGFSDQQLARFGVPTTGATVIPDPRLEIPLDYPEQTDVFDLFTAQAKASLSLYNRQQRADYKATLAEERRVTISVAQAEEKAMAQGALTYFNVLAAEEEVSALQEQVSTSEQKVDLAKDLLAAGKISALELKRDQLSLSGERRDLAEARLKLTQLLRKLKAYLDLPDSVEFEITGDLRFLPISPAPLEEAVRQARTNRIDVLIQNQSELIARLNRDSAKEAWWPTVGASAAYGFQGHTIDESVDTWMVGVNANIPIWDSHQRKGALLRRESELVQTRMNSEQLFKKVNDEIREALEQLESASNAVQVAAESVAVERDALALAQSKERAGTAKEMDVANAASLLTQARFKQIGLIYAYQQACIDWFKAIGDIQRLVPAMEAARADADRKELTPLFPEAPNGR